MRRLSPRQWIALGILGHVVLQLRPAVREVWETPSARDFASYYYAVEVAAAGGDPYSVRTLSKAAQADKSRRYVQPYFYPPPFLASVAWSLPMSLHTASKVMLVLNEALLAGCLGMLMIGFGAAPWAIALLLTTFTPIPDNAWMGQANLLALTPALAGLLVARTRPALGGILVGTAAMFKMSPALFLLAFAIQRQWRAIAAAVATAVVLSVATLPLVGWEEQVRFYREVLPGFGMGDYHGLTIPIGLPANHSIPNLFDLLWPGPTPTSLSATAALASRALAVGLLVAWAWRFRRGGREVPALGALTVLMVVLPAYTYEHHLVFLLLPVTVAAGAAPLWAFLPAYFFLAWPLDWLRAMQQQFPPLGDLLRESKFLAEMAILAMCVWPYAQREK